MAVAGGSGGGSGSGGNLFVNKKTGRGKVEEKKGMEEKEGARWQEEREKGPVF